MPDGPYLRRLMAEKNRDWPSIRDSLQLPEVDTESRPIRWRKLGPDGFPIDGTQDSRPEQAHSSTG